MASKLNFRARTLDASKPMAIYHAEELPELTDLNAINRSVPAMPSGMEKEEESEKHLQDILDAQNNKTNKEGAENLVIPTPEVFEGDSEVVYNHFYTGDYKVPRQYIHVQPFSTDNENPDYDMDDEDMEFLTKTLQEERKFEVTENTFEGMLDRLEKNSGHSAIEVAEAKSLLQEDDELILAVYDYWVDKRLRLKHSLMPMVKSDKRDFGQASASQSGGGGGSTANAGTGTNPYIAFRRRTEKMQTRKNRKNDEVSYEKMLKLRRDLGQAIVLLEMVKRREKTKKELLNLTAEIFERRYQGGDYEGRVFDEVRAPKFRVLQPSAFNHRFGGAGGAGQELWIGHPDLAPPNMVTGLATEMSTKERRRHHSHKKRKHGKSSGATSTGGGNKQKQYPMVSATPINLLGSVLSNAPEFGTSMSSDDDFLSSVTSHSDLEEDEFEGAFGFRRKRNCQYLKPLEPDQMEGPPGFQGLFSMEHVGIEPRSHPKSRFMYGSLSTPKHRYLGLIRRRVGRGGRVILDRTHTLNMPSLGGGGVFDPFEDDDRPASPSELYPESNQPVYRPVTPPQYRDDWIDASSADSGLPNNFGLLSRKHLSFNGSGDTGFNNRPTPSVGGGSTRHRSSSGYSVKPVPVDSVGAQNAASAVVTSDMIDIFNSV